MKPIFTSALLASSVACFSARGQCEYIPALPSGCSIVPSTVVLTNIQAYPPRVSTLYTSRVYGPIVTNRRNTTCQSIEHTFSESYTNTLSETWSVSSEVSRTLAVTAGRSSAGNSAASSASYNAGINVGLTASNAYSFSGTVRWEHSATQTSVTNIPAQTHFKIITFVDIQRKTVVMGEWARKTWHAANTGCFAMAGSWYHCDLTEVAGTADVVVTPTSLDYRSEQIGTCGGGTDDDSDGIPDWEDDDTDGDGITNDHDPDIDNDGIPNDQDGDMDGDGIPNDQDSDPDGLPGTDDIDGDGTPNRMDDDVDGDDIPNENDDDIDNDGIPNDQDDDMDGDGVPNHLDSDANGDGRPDNILPHYNKVRPLIHDLIDQLN